MPDKGLPAALTDLSEYLIKCVNSPPESRKQMMEEAIRMAEKISLQASAAEEKEKSESGNDGEKK